MSSHRNINDWDLMEVQPGKYRWIKKGALAEERGSAAYTVTDSMQAMRHPATGKFMDSKSAFRAVTKAHGCVEIGNDVQRDTRKFDMGNRKSDIAQAIRELGG